MNSGSSTGQSHNGVSGFCGFLVVSVALVFAAALTACGGGSPQSTLDAYAQAVADNDPQAAYDLLAESYRERVSFDEFEGRFEKQRESNGDNIVDTLEGAAGEAAFVDAALPYTEFDRLELALTREGWQIESGVFNFYGRRTPRETLNSFIKAVERRKYDVLLDFVPSAYAASMSADTIREQFEASPETIDEMVALLRQNQDQLIKTQGSRAWMDYGKFRITFVKESGEWKVEDPD